MVQRQHFPSALPFFIAAVAFGCASNSSSDLFQGGTAGSTSTGGAGTGGAGGTTSPEGGPLPDVGGLPPVVCKTSLDCVGAAGTPICDPSTGQCVGCLGDNDCMGDRTCIGNICRSKCVSD